MTVFDREQRTHISRVQNYIEENLHLKLTLAHLAKVSTYSPYHFHRLFSEFTGETPADYVKRHRLEKAAHTLIYEPEKPVTEIAIDCGFSSLSYFTYTFHETFHHSPKAWREGAYLEKFPRVYLDSKKSKQDSSKRKEENQKREYTEFQWVDLSKVKTVVLPERAIVLKHRLGEYSKEIEQTWESIFRFCHARDLLHEKTMMIGVPRNNPYITPAEKCRYDCCISIDDFGSIGDGAEKSAFPGGKYAVYEFDEPVDYSNRKLLIECYSELYSFWLPKSGYRYLGNPIELVQIVPRAGTFELDCKITAIALEIEPK
ncbi:helix-turn-helix domain-containing protein [Metabacillus idriensis]|uniref:AraC family transcriptional regulator n=1 Tax=Metabacillus idriensis TaxID=324768 RepID=UPI002812FDA0|nr:helix-turn-helix domain-containing protein [Metabacillus idriensis]MDR0139076.1 helix-turn-helix domain-containing protein [Metabacillus idriensis]